MQHTDTISLVCRKHSMLTFDVRSTGSGGTFVNNAALVFTWQQPKFFMCAEILVNCITNTNQPHAHLRTVASCILHRVILQKLIFNIVSFSGEFAARNSDNKRKICRCLCPCHKSCTEIGGQTPLILNLDARWRRVVNISPRLLYFLGSLTAVTIK